MEEKENTYQNLLNIVSAANSEDATSLYNNISKEMADRIHQELETKKIEIAADMVTKGQLTEYGMEGYGSYEDLDDTKDSGEGFKHMRDNELRMKYGIEQGENIDLEFLQTVERLVGREIAMKIAELPANMREKFFQAFIKALGQDTWDDAYGMLGMVDASEARDAIDSALKELRLN
jgi:nitrogenase molybdenum-iron protein alpha/beta subunit